jgi:molybdate transport system substrate-binding protein
VKPLLGGLLLVVVWLVAACAAQGAAGNGSAMPASSGGPSAGASAMPSGDRVELTIYAAASLKGALEAVASAYEAVTPHVRLTIATDASSTLRTQIEQGAPADVFLSADQANPTALVDAGLTDGVAVDFAGNSLTVIVPATNPAGVASPADLARPGVKVVAAGVDVPITGYATEALARLGRLAGYPTQFAAGYAANVVSREDNVKAVVAKVELGEADGAIVYTTDARASTKVRMVGIPAEANVAATYGGVVVKASPHPSEAHAFLGWLAGRDGQSVLATFGFEPLR